MIDFNNIDLDENNKKLFPFLLFFMVCGFVYVIYYDSIFYGVSSYDDHIYFDYLRSIFKDGPSVSAFLSILTDFVHSNWHPATVLSLAIDFIIGNDNPVYFHITNILIHIANVMLVYFIFVKLTGNLFASALTAILFAIHPLNIESVVWISERKGLLSAMFSLVSIYYYISYKNEDVYRKKIASILFFLLSLLSKPTSAALPLIFILLDLTIFSSRGKLDFSFVVRSLKEKLPYFISGAGIIGLAFVAQAEHGALGSLSDVPLISRLETSINSIIIYISKIFFPINLASFYPHIDKPIYITIFYIVFIFSWILLAVKYFSKSKIITFSILFFFIQIIPLSGLFQTGAHSIANRYTYLPAIGFFFLVSFFIGKISNRLIYVSLLLLLPLSITIISFNHVKVWRNDLSMWENNARVTDENYLTASYYSHHLIENHRGDDAARYFYSIIGIKNKFYAAQAIENVAIKLTEYNHYLDAKVILEKAIENNFTIVEVYRQLAFLEYFHLDNKKIARKYIKAILKSKPSDFRTNRIYGMMLFKEKKYEMALNILNKLKEAGYVDSTLNNDISHLKNLTGK